MGAEYGCRGGTDAESKVKEAIACMVQGKCRQMQPKDLKPRCHSQQRPHVQACIGLSIHFPPDLIILIYIYIDFRSS